MSVYEVIKISLMNACVFVRPCASMVAFKHTSAEPLNEKRMQCLQQQPQQCEDCLLSLFIFPSLSLSLSLSLVTSFWAFSIHFAFVCCHVNFQLRNLNCIDNNNNKKWNIININEVNIKFVCVCMSECRA